jgi:hypothetical protein
MKTLNQKMKSISPARRKKVEARADGLIAEDQLCFPALPK